MEVSMRSNRIICICLYCHNTFSRQPNQVRRGEDKFCSVPCKRAAHVKTPAERLWEKVDQSAGADACWPYSSVVEGKYAIVGYDAGGPRWKGIGAHVLAYTLTKGPVTKGMIVRHTCDNPRCCNPAHLLTGSYKENMADAVERQRTSSGKFHKPNAKLTWEIVREIRTLGKNMSATALAKKYNVSIPTISAILRNISWRE